MTQALEKKLEQRFIDLIDETADSQTDELTFSFSSETPVQRNGFSEVLDHSVESVDLSRLKNSAPFLFNHDMNKPIGRVKNAWIENWFSFYPSSHILSPGLIFPSCNPQQAHHYICTLQLFLLSRR